MHKCAAMVLGSRRKNKDIRESSEMERPADVYIFEEHSAEEFAPVMTDQSTLGTKVAGLKAPLAENSVLGLRADVRNYH